jgi:hypothetical protein
MKGVGRWFGSAPSGCERAAHGATARTEGDAVAWTEGDAVARVSDGGRRPPGGLTSAGVDHELGQCGKNPKENENGLPTRSGLKCELGFRMDFRIDFMDFEFKSKGLNISKPKFEPRSK